jgi:hypothetical protein
MIGVVFYDQYSILSGLLQESLSGLLSSFCMIGWLEDQQALRKTWPDWGLFVQESYKHKKSVLLLF